MIHVKHVIERTTSYRRIKKLAPDWELVVSDELYYLIDVINGRDTGVWVFVPCEGGFNVHAEMGKECRGAIAARSARDAFAWLFDNTQAQVIFADIPCDLRHVHMMASHIGMTFNEMTSDLRCFAMAVEDFAEMRKAA